MNEDLQEVASSKWEGPGWYLLSSEARYFEAPPTQESALLEKLPPPKFALRDIVLCKWGPDKIQGLDYRGGGWRYHFMGRQYIPESSLTTMQEEIARQVGELLPKLVQQALSALSSKEP